MRVSKDATRSQKSVAHLGDIIVVCLGSGLERLLPPLERLEPLIAILEPPHEVVMRPDLLPDPPPPLYPTLPQGPLIQPSQDVALGRRRRDGQLGQCSIDCLVRCGVLVQCVERSLESMLHRLEPHPESRDPPLETADDGSPEWTILCRCIHVLLAVWLRGGRSCEGWSGSERGAAREVGLRMGTQTAWRGRTEPRWSQSVVSQLTRRVAVHCETERVVRLIQFNSQKSLSSPPSLPHVASRYFRASREGWTLSSNL